MRRTDRDEELLRALSLCVRMFTLEQIAARWWDSTPTGEANARRRLKRLRDANLLIATRVAARPFPPAAAPVYAWDTEQDDEPHYGAISWQLKKRWVAPCKRVAVYHATRDAAAQYGGCSRGELKLPDQASHDLGLSQVYLHYLVNFPELASRWIGEDAIHSRRGQKTPDAVIQSPRGGIQLVVEFGGEYPPERVRAFHNHCQEQGVPYELW